MSKPALWATSTVPRANSKKLGSTWAIRGWVATIALVMPVRTAITAGMWPPGLTSVWYSPTTSPPHTLTAPISVICASGPLPVVSRSTTQKVICDRGVPRSSKDGWSAR